MADVVVLAYVSRATTKKGRLVNFFALPQIFSSRTAPDMLGSAN